MTEDEMVGWLTYVMDMSLSRLLVVDREACYATVPGVEESGRTE